MINKLKKFIELIIVVLLSSIKYRMIREIVNAKFSNYYIEPFKQEDLKEIELLYEELNNGKKIDKSKKNLLRKNGDKICFVAKEYNFNTIIGIEIYYYNLTDLKNNTIHQGFRGVRPDWQGQGVVTAITKKAKDHFRINKFSGITSRVDIDNKPSIKSNSNLGFRVENKYFDKTEGVFRYYMICIFKEN